MNPDFSFYQDNHLIDWNIMSRLDYLSEEFMLHFSDKIVWKHQVFKSTLSEEFILKVSGKLGLIVYDLLLCRPFSETFLKRLGQTLDDPRVWHYISKYQILSTRFMLEFHDRLDWTLMLCCQKVLQA